MVNGSFQSQGSSSFLVTSLLGSRALRAQMSTSDKSPRTAVQPAPGAQEPAQEPAAKELDIRELIETIWTTLIWLLTSIVRLLHTTADVVADVAVKLYRICVFCYRKPRHARELLVTTVHLIRVSYDAEIWTCADFWEVLKSHLIAPMTKTPTPTAASSSSSAKTSASPATTMSTKSTKSTKSKKTM